MIQTIKKYYTERPLVLIIIVTVIFRLLAAIFSKGFSMLDDHFNAVEFPQYWVDGSDKFFRPGSLPHIQFIYLGLHYVVFYLFDKILLVTDPQVKMFFIRLIHAGFSVFTVIYSYKITEKISNRENARTVGFILALFWPLSFLSVRSLVEVFCMPPALIGVYYLIKSEETDKSLRNIIFAGVFIALSFTFRFQIAVLAAGIGVVFLFRRNWQKLVWFSFGFLITITITLGLVDYIAWKFPFFTLYNYIEFNIANRYNYVTQPWYNYILLLAGILIPPVSFFFFTGFFRKIKKLPFLFWPTLLFLFFHSYFPNKQERFILPVVPFFIILGIIGWNEYVVKSKFWQQKKSLLKISWGWFWGINLILLIILTFTYSKKNRVESLYYLSKKNDLKAVIWESDQKNVISPPKFYLNKKVPIFTLPTSKTLKDIDSEILKQKPIVGPNYIIFIGEKDIEVRKENIKSHFNKNLKYEITIEPSLVDYIFYKLNPKRNVNQISFIYKLE